MLKSDTWSDLKGLIFFLSRFQSFLQLDNSLGYVKIKFVNVTQTTKKFQNCIKVKVIDLKTYRTVLTCIILESFQMSKILKFKNN